MAAARYDIPINQGSDYAFSFVVKEDGVVKDLTGYNARAAIRNKLTSPTAAANFTCLIANPTDGTVDVSLPNATSAAMDVRTYVYDLEIYTAGDVIVLALLYGDVPLKGEVTR